MKTSNVASDAISLPERASLTLSPKAPPMQFLANGNSLQLGETFSMRNLRFESPQGPTAVARTEQGYYYRPQWPVFTQFLDCQDRHAIKASVALASLPWDSTAPELGLDGTPAKAILSKQVSHDKFDPSSKASLIWNTDLPFLSYMKKLPSAQLKALLKEEGPALLEHCLLVRKFLAADFLWDKGVRLSPDQLESGKALWGMAESAFLATPSLPMLENMLDIQAFEKEMRANKGELSEWLAPWKAALERKPSGDAEVTLRASLLFMAYSHRWLNRLVDEGINPNSTLNFKYVLVDGREKTVPKRVLPLLCEQLWSGNNPQMWQKHTIQGHVWLLPEVNLAVWFKAMERAGFDWHLPVPNLHSEEPISFIDEAKRMSLPAPLKEFLRLENARHLEQVLDQPASLHRKTRL